MAMPRRLELAAIVAGLVGCGPHVDHGSGAESTGASTSLATGSTTGTGDDPTVVGEVVGSVSADVDSDTFPEDWGSVTQTCTPSETFACGNGVVCDESCGDPFSPFDAAGCLRPSCPCVDGEVCFTPLDYGGCVSSGITCQESAGVCQCAMDPDCGGSYCLPAVEVPALPCLDLQTPAECDRSNCRWLAGTDVSQDDTGCVCFIPAGVCVAPLEYRESSPGAIFYRVDDPSRAVWLDPAPSPTPLGLARCGVDEDAEVCGCGGPCE